MSHERNQTESDQGELRQFEKNRFFQGKLMTARDMQTEQTYHARRVHTLGRFGIGKGILYGVEVSDIVEKETELEITVEPGVLIDGYGRPIVVEHTTTRTLPLPEGDEFYLFLRYSETELESVPVPEVRGASGEEYMSNRTVEGFELTYQASPPDSWDEIPDANTSIADNADDDTALRALANRYHQRFRSSVEPVEDPSIFIAAFERTRDGDWIRGGDTVRRDLVYDNDMLYSALVHHLADTDNPHDVSGVGGAGSDMELDDVDEIRYELEQMRDRLDTLNRYVMRKSLKDKIRFFQGVYERFEEHDTSGSQIAQRIAETAREGISDEVHEDPDAFREHAGEMLQNDIELGDALKESATEESLERYIKAVNELQSVLASDVDVLSVAEAQDAVAEAADSLEVLYDIVPED